MYVFLYTYIFIYVNSYIYMSGGMQKFDGTYMMI